MSSPRTSSSTHIMQTKLTSDGQQNQKKESETNPTNRFGLTITIPDDSETHINLHSPKVELTPNSPNAQNSYPSSPQELKPSAEWLDRSNDAVARLRDLMSQTYGDQGDEIVISQQINQDESTAGDESPQAGITMLLSKL